MASPFHKLILVLSSLTKHWQKTGQDITRHVARQRKEAKFHSKNALTRPTRRRYYDHDGEIIGFHQKEIRWRITSWGVDPAIFVSRVYSPIKKVSNASIQLSLRYSILVLDLRSLFFWGRVSGKASIYDLQVFFGGFTVLGWWNFGFFFLLAS